METTCQIYYMFGRHFFQCLRKIIIITVHVYVWAFKQVNQKIPNTKNYVTIKIVEFPNLFFTSKYRQVSSLVIL